MQFNERLMLKTRDLFSLEKCLQIVVSIEVKKFFDLIKFYYKTLATIKNLLWRQSAGILFSY